MKLRLSKVKKSYDDRVLFEEFDFEFKESGFYLLVGESGSGKTTLLNILSLLDKKYEGTYEIDCLDAKKIKEKDKNKILSNNFGYVFQNFNLLDDDTLFNNIYLKIDSSSKLNVEDKKKKTDEILKQLDIYKLKDEYIKNLSGGEKQRAAIARAIVNSPDVIFCDEPTGSLDSLNCELVFKILKIISKNTTVICATHDLEMAKKYGDYILSIKNKRIINEVNKSVEVEDNFMTMKVLNKKDSPYMSIKFIIQHLKNKMKNRKIRNLIKNFLITISLISTGLSIGLTDGLQSTLMNSFKTIVNENTVILNKKDCKNAIFDYYSAEESDIARLMNIYKDDLDYYGVNYTVDFENYFPQDNSLYLDKSGENIKLNGFNIRTFNEFIYEKDLNKLNTYPSNIKELKNDEIVLSINYEQMKEICLNLRIARDFESLGNYCLTHNLMVILKARNKDWWYEDEQIFKVKGFILDSKNRVYHTNNLFNQNLFEEKMRFPTSNQPNKIEDKPWIFKKVFYVHTKKFQSYFLNKVFYDDKYKDFIFDSDNDLYSPINCSYSTQVTNRVYVYNVFKDSIDINMIKNIEELNFEYKNYYFSTIAGYYNSGTSIFNGFSKPTFFSFDLDKIDSIIDAHSKVKEEDYLNIKVPSNVVDGYAFKTNSSNIRFKTNNNELAPNEIIISEGFRKILGEKDVINKNIYASMMVQSVSNNDEIKNEFKTIMLKVKDVVENDKSVVLYQNKDFSISLFRDLFKISSFNLVPTSIIFETDNRVRKKELDRLNSSFGEYELSNPIIEIEKNIDESTKFLKIILYAFSGVAIVSAIVLLLIISLINAIEARKEIAIFKIQGFSLNEILKIFILDNLFVSLISFALSTFALVFISFLVGNNLSSMLGCENVAIISLSSILFNFIIILVISVISALSTIKELKTVNFQEILH